MELMNSHVDLNNIAIGPYRGGGGGWPCHLICTFVDVDLSIWIPQPSKAYCMCIGDWISILRELGKVS
jgi:hypothetical protein